jgi:hypothetical protein
LELQEFRKRIDALPVIDTHEHWPPERFCVGRPLDFFDLLVPYVVDNLTNAGMSVAEWAFLANRANAFDARWELLARFLDDVRDTTYFRVLTRTLRDQFGFTDFTRESALEVGRRLTASNTEGLYARTMDQEHIESTLTFVGWDGLAQFHDPRVHPIPTVSDLCPRSVLDIERISAVAGVPVTGFDSLLGALSALFDSYKGMDVKAVKFGSAYRRKLDFRAVTREEAESVFVRILSEKLMGDSRIIGSRSTVMPLDDVRPLDDYLTDRMVDLAQERGMPVFFHVGIHAWNQNSVEAVRASYLEGLIRRHPEAVFILLHCGMPFVDEATLLCRYFPNVHLNMTWTHIIDTAQARLCVRKFVEMLPANRIQGFGGDYVFPQQIHGHLAFAKENIALGLWSLVEENELDADRAVGIARKWLYENPKKVLSI